MWIGCQISYIVTTHGYTSSLQCKWRFDHVIFKVRFLNNSTVLGSEVHPLSRRRSRLVAERMGQCEDDVLRKRR